MQVHHVLNHTSGMHNALSDLSQENPLLMCNWDECLNRIANTVPETSPGEKQLYHYLSFGWLCGGIAEVLLTLFLSDFLLFVYLSSIYAYIAFGKSEFWS